MKAKHEVDTADRFSAAGPSNASFPARRSTASSLRAAVAVSASASVFVLATAGVNAAPLSYSGTTTTSTTWDRPVANGVSAPTTLSDDGTAVGYQAQTFTAATTGTYDLTSVVPSPATASTLATWDNFAVLYHGTFSASAPLTNVVVANDDDNGVIGVSALLGVSLTAGQSYTLVTTGLDNGDFGSFSNTVYQESQLAAGTTLSGSTWDPFGTGAAIPYSVTAFTVSTAGAYNFLSTSSFDNFTALYSTSFNPSSPNTNLINSNDDSSVTDLSGFADQALATGTTYYLVTTGTSASAAGAFVDTISGPGSVVPEPASVSILLASAGILGRRGRRSRSTTK